MMANSLTQKLALLSCASTCLLTLAVNANDDSTLNISGTDPNNITCGADERILTYVIRNDGYFPVSLDAVFIEREDSFPRDLVTVDYSVSDDPYRSCSRYLFDSDRLLNPRHSCEIQVKIDPAYAECTAQGPAPSPNDVIRELAVLYRTVYCDGTESCDQVNLDFFSEAEIDIDFDVTVLGSSYDFSLLAVGDITDVEPGDGSDQDGPIQVFQNVGADGDVTDDIYYHDPAIQVVDVAPTNLLSAALSDAQTAYSNIMDIAAATDLLGCNAITDAQLASNTINPGIYCLTPATPGPILIVGSLDFSGKGDFIFVIDTDTDVHVGDTSGPVNYTLADGAETKHVYWVGGEEFTLFNNTTGQDSSTFLGTILTAGNVTTNDDTDDSFDIPLSLDGRILAVNPCADCNPSTGAAIALQGNSINGDRKDHQ